MNAEETKPLSEMAELALQQFIGFHHASMGLSIESLVQGMGLTREEWEAIRNDCVFTEESIEALDNYFSEEERSN